MTRFRNPQQNRRMTLKKQKNLRGAYATPRFAYAPFFLKIIDLTRGLRDTAAMLTRELFMFVFCFLRFSPYARPYALVDVAYATPIFTPFTPRWPCLHPQWGVGTHFTLRASLRAAYAGSSEILFWGRGGPE